MRLPTLIAIGSFLVLQVDHADRLVGVEQADSRRAATRIVYKQAADIPSALIVQVENQAKGPGQWARRPDAVVVPIDRLAPDAGVVVGAASDGSVVSVRAARSLKTAYDLERQRVSPSIPRAVLGVVYARLIPPHRRLAQGRRR